MQNSNGINLATRNLCFYYSVTFAAAVVFDFIVEGFSIRFVAFSRAHVEVLHLHDFAILPLLNDYRPN